MVLPSPADTNNATPSSEPGQTKKSKKSKKKPKEGSKPKKRCAWYEFNKTANSHPVFGARLTELKEKMSSKEFIGARSKLLSTWWKTEVSAEAKALYQSMATDPSPTTLQQALDVELLSVPSPTSVASLSPPPPPPPALPSTPASSSASPERKPKPSTAFELFMGTCDPTVVSDPTSTWKAMSAAEREPWVVRHKAGSVTYKNLHGRQHTHDNRTASTKDRPTIDKVRASTAKRTNAAKKAKKTIDMFGASSGNLAF